MTISKVSKPNENNKALAQPPKLKTKPRLLLGALIEVLELFILS